MDVLSKDLLNYIQTDFPLVEEPFEYLAKMFNVSEEQVITTIKDLKDNKGLIRTISAIFDGRKLGYKSALIALTVSDQNLPHLINELDLHPGVSHNYSRKHVYNLWFTIALSENKDIDYEIKKISSKYDVENYLILPSIKTYKLKVNFKIAEKNNLQKANVENNSNVRDVIVDNQDKLIIKQLQQELPLVSRPFDQLADNIGLTVVEFLERANYYNVSGLMRRYCATLRHVKAGYKANAMVVWCVNLSCIDKIGAKVANYYFVSHCYQRETFQGWPYNFFTMVHAKNDDELKNYLDQLKAVINPSSYEVLETLKEHKKTRVKYSIE